LQVTPPAQLLAPAPEQVTVQVEPLQLIWPAQEFLPEHSTTLAAALVLMPPAQERRPSQEMSHWLPEQFTDEKQLSVPPQVICVLEAILVSPVAQLAPPVQVTVHSLPPH
jgi:hypothetical protein